MEDLIKNIVNENDVVIIANYVMKNQIIKKISEKNKLINITYKSFTQVVDDMLGTYSRNARIDLANKYNITIELASIKLKNSLLVNNLYSNKKINDLNNIKKEYQSYLVKKPLAINIYKNKKVYIINDYQTNDLFNIARFELSKYVELNDYFFNQYYEKDINVYPFDNLKQEVNFLVKEVAKLIERGISYKNIKINNLPQDYYPYLKEAFSLTNIDIDLYENYSLYEYELTKEFLRLLENYEKDKIHNAFEEVINTLTKKINKKQANLLQKITSVLISYMRFNYLVKDVYQDLVYSFKNLKIAPINYTNNIVLTNLFDEDILEDDFVFIIGCNQDIFPKVFLDDDYLLDFERENLGLVTSRIKNKQERTKYLDLVNRSKNIFLSYNLELPTPKSSFIDYLGNYYNVTENLYKDNNLISYSKTIDQLSLGKRLDLYYKYEIKDEYLYLLYENYPNNLYRKYSHKFKGVDQTLLDNFLKNSLVLSYTSIDKYFKCAFSFYIEKVLKIYRSTNEDALFIGNIFHEVLNQLLIEDVIVDLDTFIYSVIDEVIKKENKTLTKKDKFFINKYVEVLKELYIYLKTQRDNSKFDIFGLEKEFIIEIDKKYKVLLKGKIDKILTYKFNDQNYAVVLDYKSGNAEFDLNNIIYGLNMQILFYFYFLNYFSDEKYYFAGGYLQGVLPTSVFNRDSKYTLKEQLLNHFKLYGYSSENKQILKFFDKNYDNENRTIRGLRITANGEFYKGTKIITENDFWKLLEVVEQKINYAIDNIFNGNFEINPKKIKSFDSCMYCPYSDLCYRDINDYQELKPVTNFDFLKEEL